jgi:ABC-2 type transport system permease protein
LRGITTIAAREWGTYTSSPVAYVVAAVFLALTGYLFSIILFSSREATLRYVFDNISFLLVLISPLITMRLFAEERRNGTMELLLTLPFRESEVVLGKFFASMMLLVMMLLPTLWYAALLLFVARNLPDPGPLAAGYLGLLLQGGALLALGLFASSLTSNQVVAAVIAFTIGISMWLIGAVGSYIGGPQLAEVLSFLTISERFQDFARGIIDLRSVVFYLSLIAAFLFLTYTSLQTRRWL